MIPSTVQGLAILVLTALPGLTYLAAREQLLGPRPSEEETANRLLRAFAVSVILDAVYLITIGPQLVTLLSGKGSSILAGVARHPRQAGLVALVLIIAIPAAVAWVEAEYLRRRHKVRYEETPTAWDALFRRRSSCFIRVKLKSGTWVGGWYGNSSNASAYPQAADLYLQSQRRMNADGTFGDKIPGTGGVYIQSSDIEVLEILESGQQAEGASDDRANRT